MDDTVSYETALESGDLSRHAHTHTHEGDTTNETKTLLKDMEGT